MQSVKFTTNIKPRGRRGKGPAWQYVLLIQQHSADGKPCVWKTGVLDFKPEIVLYFNTYLLNTMREWFASDCSGNAAILNNIIAFEDRSDALMFKMRFG